MVFIDNFKKNKIKVARFFVILKSLKILQHSKAVGEEFVAFWRNVIYAVVKLLISVKVVIYNYLTSDSYYDNISIYQS